MKFKKFSLALALATCGVFAVTLSSCEGSKKVTYIDDEGNEQTVTIKKTSDEDQIVDAVTAFVYSKGDTKFKPNGIELNAKVEGKVSGVQNSDNKKFNYGGSVSAKAALTFGKYDENENKDEIAEYLEVNASAKIPAAAVDEYLPEFTPKKDKVTLLANSADDEDIDYTKTYKVSTLVRVYGEAEEAYLNVAKLSIPYDDLGEPFTTYKNLINDNIVGKYIKVDKTVMDMIPSSAMDKLPAPAKMLTSMGMESIAKLYYSMYTEDTTFVDTIYKLLSANYEKVSDFKEEFKGILKDQNIVISSVDGNKMTVKYNFAVKDGKDEDYKGKSYVALTVDLNKKVPLSIKADAGDYITWMANKALEEDSKEGAASPVKNVKISLNGSVTAKYSPKVTKLAEKYKKDATNLPQLINLLK